MGPTILLRKFSLALLAALFLGLTSTAQAETVFIVGNTHPTLATATITCTLNGNVLTLEVENTSPFAARITGVGIDLPPGGAPGLDGFTGANVGDFALTDVDQNVNQFPDALLDFAFITGANFQGGGAGGLAAGDSITFTVTSANFANFTEEEICAGLFVRFQTVGEDGQLSDVGTPGNGDQPIPEPASMVLLGMGLSGVAAAVRRRNRKKT